ncbi:class I SAM-dependent DNA methyltransferase [Pararoseomonas indoligenes]|uniref:Class I SAM-dependent methyltransferase n=1 Tax=Roseomonas indoligenes TaxID=2820811 RepID=A0A940N3D5_9PROT|nr:class I SAM-dependent methyltransferase [Pararoseomonas indoligenes]MBP0496493.1 class I SAM-dependent methyltransferase [Pararoseomonas indoligenes]
MQTPPHHCFSEPASDMELGSRRGTAGFDAWSDRALPSLYDQAELYDAIVQPGPCEAFYREEAQRQGGPVLELACGTGRLTLPIAADGHEVIGLDASHAMLAAAARKAGERRLSANFVLGDIRDFDLGRRFGMVIISCNSLAHLTEAEDLRACLAAVRRHLAPGGLFAFDVVSPDLSTLGPAGSEARRLDLGPNPSSAIMAKEISAYDPITQVRTAQWQVRQSGGAVQVLAPLVLRQFFPQEVPWLLEVCGFLLAERYGDFARNPLDRGSLNQVCLARMA